MEKIVTTIPIIKPSLNELSHVGVKGMHWGHHKRVDESDSIKKAREHLKKTSNNVSIERKRYNKETGYGSIIASTETQKRLNSAVREHGYAKQDLSSAKILDKINSKEKSKSQLKFEEKYKQKGMSDNEAAIAAYKHIRTKNMLIAVGAVTVTAAVAYGGYKYHDANVDKLIKSGTKLQNISADSTNGVRDAFYSSTNKMDNIKYKGIYGDHLFNNNNVYQKEIKTLTDLKQVSPKNAHNILSDMAKNDPEFMSGLKDAFKTNVENPAKFGNGFTDKFKSAEKSLSKGIIDKNVYEAFNVALVDHSEGQQKLTNKFFDTLSSKGYNAIKDVNDVKYSGYKTINPIITFGASGKINVTNVKELTYDEIKKANKIGMGMLDASSKVKAGAQLAAIIVSAKGASSAINNSRNTKLVDNYRKENPKSKLSNTEIIRMIERSK